MVRQSVEYGRFHPDAPVLSLPGSFYPPKWRDEEHIANPSAYLRVQNASGNRWRIEPGYDVENKKHYRTSLDRFYYLDVSFAAGYFDVFAIEDEERRTEQPVFYKTYVYNFNERTFRRVETEGPINEIRRTNDFVAIPVPSGFVKGVRLFLAERSAIGRDRKHFLKELSTPH